MRARDLGWLAVLVFSCATRSAAAQDAGVPQDEAGGPAGEASAGTADAAPETDATGAGATEEAGPAGEAGATGEAVPPAEATPPPPPPPRPPYTLPFTLRPAATPAAVVRLDTMLDVNNTGAALTPILNVLVRAMPELMVLARTNFATTLPNTGGDHSVFGNPLLGAIYAPAVPHNLRPAFFLGVTLPLGGGEGMAAPTSPPTPPNPLADPAALTAGRRGRMSLENALFATNYFMSILGAGLAWCGEGLTVQLDMTLLYGAGVRSLASPATDFTNFVVGLGVAYAVLPWLAIGVELRHQHFIDMPDAVFRAQASNPSVSQEYQTSLGGGVRFRIPIANNIVAPVGISYSRGLDGWMWAYDSNVFQLDLPLLFL